MCTYDNINLGKTLRSFDLIVSTLRAIQISYLEYSLPYSRVSVAVKTVSSATQPFLSEAPMAFGHKTQ